jgi:hypothetical protein
VLADLGKVVIFIGASASTLNLPSAPTVPVGAGFKIRNGGSAPLTIDPSGAELVNGAATLVLPPGDAAMLVRDGVAWTALRMLTNVAPIPTALAGLGKVETLYAGNNTALNLPAGGQWFYFYIQRVISSLGLQSTSMGIAAGGTNISTATVGLDHLGWCWRIG